MRSPLAVRLAAGLAILALGAPAEGAPPDVVAQAGGTWVVEGEPDGSGVSLALSLLWPLEDSFRVGLMVFADGLGDRTGRLVSPSGQDLGPIAVGHQAARGVAWRMEATRPGGFLEPYLSASWGVYRVADDVRGDLLRRAYAAGFGLGAGAVRPFGARHAVGLGVRFHQLSRGGPGRYLSAALEWRWRHGATE